MACGRDEVPEIAAKRMVQLKKERNAFAHVGEKSITFDEFMKDAIAVVCHIAHLTTDMDRISSYPWEDHLETFVPQT